MRNREGVAYLTRFGSSFSMHFRGSRDDRAFKNHHSAGAHEKFALVGERIRIVSAMQTWGVNKIKETCRLVNTNVIKKIKMGWRLKISWF